VGLRYCPACAAGERSRFGECYWHRLHQVPGALLCAEHDLLLEYVPLRFGPDVKMFAFHSAESRFDGSAASGRCLPPEHSWAPTLRRLVADSAWLLNQDVRPVENEQLRQR